MATLSWPVIRPLAEKFEGVGMQFNAKLIGIMDVPELKGDKMCFDAMQMLKAEVRKRGEHKPRITVGVSFDGISIHGSPIGMLLHQHAVRCISFIWRDPTDARAFGYITALTADTKKQFFAIKTEKTSDQVIMALKEMFQVILERRKEVDEKKKEEEEKEKEKEKERAKEKEKAAEEKKEESKAPPAIEPPPKQQQPESSLLDLNDPNSFYDTVSTAAAPAPVPKEDPNRNPLEDVFSDAFGAPPPAAAAAPAVPPAVAASLYANNDLFGSSQPNLFAPQQQQQPQQSAYQNLANLVSSTPYGAAPQASPYALAGASSFGMQQSPFGMQQQSPFGMQQSPFGMQPAAAAAMGNPFGARSVSYPAGPALGAGAPAFGIAPNPFGGSQAFGGASAAVANPFGAAPVASDILQPSRPGGNPFGSATAAPLPAAPIESAGPTRPRDPFGDLVDSIVDKKDQFGSANKAPGPMKTMNEIAFDRLVTPGPGQPASANQSVNLFDAPTPGSALLIAQPQQPMFMGQPAAAPAKSINDIDLLFT